MILLTVFLDKKDCIDCLEFKLMLHFKPLIISKHHKQKKPLDFYKLAHFIDLTPEELRRQPRNQIFSWKSWGIRIRWKTWTAHQLSLKTWDSDLLIPCKMFKLKLSYLLPLISILWPLPFPGPTTNLLLILKSFYKVFQ